MRSTALVRGGCLVTVLLLAACGSSPGNPAAPPVVAGAECAGLPTYNPTASGASSALVSDKTLEARFPAQIDGQPVTEVTSGRLLETMCEFGGQAGIDAVRTTKPAVLSLLNMSVGSARATVDGQSVILSAARLPGASAGELLQDLATIIASSGSDTNQFNVSDLKDATVGGKAVKTWTDASGKVTYVYVSGDTLITLDSVTPAQAEKIFTAIS